MHLNKTFGKRRLSQISLLLVERYRVGRLAEVSFSTVNRELSALKGILNKAIDWEKLASFPIRKIEIDVKSEPRRDRVLTPKEEVRLLAEACCRPSGRKYLQRRKNTRKNAGRALSKLLQTRQLEKI